MSGRSTLIMYVPPLYDRNIANTALNTIYNQSIKCMLILCIDHKAVTHFERFTCS